MISSTSRHHIRPQRDEQEANFRTLTKEKSDRHLVGNTTEDGSAWHYTYNDRGELTDAYKDAWSASSHLRGRTYEYAYDNIGNRKTYKSGGDVNGNSLRTATYTTVNNRNQYTSISNPNTFDVAGMSTYPVVKVNPVAAARQYDYYHRELTHSSRPGLLEVTVQDCDSGGNPQGAPEIGDVYVPVATESPGYDDEGNQLSDSRWDYVWDAENRLKEMRTRSGSGIASSSADSLRLVFDYDCLGRRIQKRVYSYYNQSVPTSGTLEKTEKFLWDGWECLAKIDGSNTEAYVWGPDVSGVVGGAGGVGGLLMAHELNASYSLEKTRFAAYDGNGNLMALVSPTGSEVTARYEYDPFGNTIRESGSYGETNAWRYSTKWEDSESGLNYYGYRYYDPRNGRWLSRDPIEEEGGLNLYGFVGNDGVNSVDILGQWTLEEAKNLLKAAKVKPAIPARTHYNPYTGKSTTPARYSDQQILINGMNLKRIREKAGIRSYPNARRNSA